MNKNKKMLGIGAVAILAAILITSSNVGTHDLFAKKYGQSNAQSAAVSNECTPVTDAGNDDNPIDVFANTVANCIGSIPQNQDSDGAVVTSKPSASSDNDQGD